jgi:hypothetical protein
MRLVEFVRKELHGYDANVSAYDGFMNKLAPELEKIRNREHELAQAAKNTIARTGRSRS